MWTVFQDYSDPIVLHKLGQSLYKNDDDIYNQLINYAHTLSVFEKTKFNSDLSKTFDGLLLEKDKLEVGYYVVKSSESFSIDLCKCTIVPGNIFFSESKDLTKTKKISAFKFTLINNDEKTFSKENVCLSLTHEKKVELAKQFTDVPVFPTLPASITPQTMFKLQSELKLKLASRKFTSTQNTN